MFKKTKSKLAVLLSVVLCVSILISIGSVFAADINSSRIAVTQQSINGSTRLMIEHRYDDKTVFVAISNGFKATRVVMDDSGLSLAKSGLGYVPVVGTVIDIVDTAVGVIEGGNAGETAIDMITALVGLIPGASTFYAVAATVSYATIYFGAQNNARTLFDQISVS
ncbi:MAG: hypothetical protein WAX04_11375 [Oscillospiraceae bacterium]